MPRPGQLPSSRPAAPLAGYDTRAASLPVANLASASQWSALEFPTRWLAAELARVPLLPGCEAPTPSRPGRQGKGRTCRMGWWEHALEADDQMAREKGSLKMASRQASIASWKARE